LLGFTDPAQKELQHQLQNSGGKCQALTLTQIKQATENFKTTIGIGGFGEVYYGKLVNGQEIAVKTLSTTSHQTEQEVFNEVTKFYNLKYFYVKSSKKLSRSICPCLLCQINSYVSFTIGSSDLFWQIELLSMVHHKYLVSLVGYCLDRKHLMLVYEYVSGGDLRKRLHGNGH
jgi:serine/threonine protein kinase